MKPIRNRTRLIGPPLSDEEAAVVARFDTADPAPESYRPDRDDDLEPRRYTDMGAHQVDVWPETWEVTE